MKTRPLLLALTLVLGSLGVARLEGAEKFQKLNGSQVRAKLAGMEFTDEVHWRDVFGSTGSLSGYSMGRKTAGKWSVQKDRLCLDRGKDPGSGCYDVWVSGNHMELRSQDSELPMQGVVRKPTGSR